MSGEGGREAREPRWASEMTCHFLHFRFVSFPPVRRNAEHVLSSRACCTGMVIAQCETARCMAVLRRCSARPDSSLCSVARAQSPECSMPRSPFARVRRSMPVRRCRCGYCRARRSVSAVHLHDIAHCGPCVHVGLNVASGHPCDPLVHTIACPGCVAPCCKLRYQGGCWSSWCAVTRVVSYVRVACVPFLV